MKGFYQHKDLLGLTKNDHLISLGEGGTPLLRSRHIGHVLGLQNLFFKMESHNPTGSYKDRFAAMAISELVKNGRQLCLATSSGNTGASLAAYCAVAGILCHIVVVDGAPINKLQQMQAYGATLWMVKDFGKDDGVTRQVFTYLQELALLHETEVQISAFAYSPLGMRGVETIAYEVADECPAIQHVFVPAGGGGLALAIAQGFEKYNNLHEKFVLPKVNCVQPSGNDTIATNLSTNLMGAKSISKSTTTISGLQVPSVIDGNEVVVICRRNGGLGFVVKDEKVFKWQRTLAMKEGIYCEPAAAVALAGLVEAIKQDKIDPNDYIVCLITGHGFKDMVATERMVQSNAIKYINSIDTLKIGYD